MWNRDLMTVFEAFEEEFELFSQYKCSKLKDTTVNEYIPLSLSSSYFYNVALLKVPY